MKKVLQVYPEFNNAGTETVIMTIFDNTNKDEYQIDFLAQRKGSLDKKILEKGAKIYYVENNNNKKYTEELKQFFQKNHYDIIHTHTDKDMGQVLKVANICGIEKRIAHSHNARQDVSKILKIIKQIKSYDIVKNANCFFSCSIDAAKWLFSYKYKETKIIKNGIDVEKFIFSKVKNKELEKEINYKDGDILILNVGRLVVQKNQEYILKVSEKIIQKNKKYKVLIIGRGPLKEKFEKYIKNKGLEENIFLIGEKDNIVQYMSYSKIFIFPSLHEGLGIVAIEAQANGLPVLASENVPLEANLKVDLYECLKLNDNMDKWVEKIENMIEQSENIDRIKINEAIVNSDYNAKKAFFKIYD